MDDGLGVDAEVERRCELGCGGLSTCYGKTIGEGRQRDQRIVGDDRGGDLLVVAGTLSIWTSPGSPNTRSTGAP